MGWKALGPILQLINRLLDWFEQQQRAKDYEDRQDKRDKAKVDPGNSFAGHFSNGLCSDKADDAKTASQADLKCDGKSDG